MRNKKLTYFTYVAVQNAVKAIPFTGIQTLPVERTLFTFGFVDVIKGPKGYLFSIGGEVSTFQEYSTASAAEHAAIDSVCKKSKSA